MYVGIFPEINLQYWWSINIVNPELKITMSCEDGEAIRDVLMMLDDRIDSIHHALWFALENNAYHGGGKCVVKIGNHNGSYLIEIEQEKSWDVRGIKNFKYHGGGFKEYCSCEGWIGHSKDGKKTYLMSQKLININ